jgi:hypothetical protein
MLQLDLFQHAPRDYYEALRCLGGLHLAGCGAALARHRVNSPHGPDPGPVEEAAAWLAARLPAPGDDLVAFGRSAWSLCATVQRRWAPTLLAPDGKVGEEVMAEVAGRALQRMGQAGVPPSRSLVPGLPWGVLHLFADRPVEARESLLAYLMDAEPSAVACQALGQACRILGRADEASRAFREGCSLDPGADAWPWSNSELAEKRSGFAGDPIFSGEWWVVGAYLLGEFPPYEKARPVLITKRWRRFLRDREAWAGGQFPAPVLFFAGLFLSEQGSLLEVSELAMVRNALRELHPDAYALHMEILAEREEPLPFAGREYFAW